MDEANLPRQVLYHNVDIGRPKVVAARERLGWVPIWQLQLLGQLLPLKARCGTIGQMFLPFSNSKTPSVLPRPPVSRRERSQKVTLKHPSGDSG